MAGATLESSTDPLFLKNVLEHASTSQMQARTSLADSESQHFNCPLCPFTNASQLHVQMHVLTVHSNHPQASSALPTILCPLCQGPHHERSQLENHLIETHSVTKEGVQRLMLLVDTTELDKFILENQQKDHSMNQCRDTNFDEDDDEHRSACSADSKVIDDELDRANSITAANNANVAILDHLFCPTCNRMFLNLDELFSHINEQMHINVNSSNHYQCWRTGCGQTFKNISATLQHFKEQHFLKCVKMTNSSASLASNAPVSDRHVYKFRCSQCSLAFKTFEKLQLHSQYHLIRAATQCVICGRNFRSVESMQKHVESCHQDMNEEELEQYKTSLVNNQLLLALHSNGGILDPSTNELLRKESSRLEGTENESMDVDDEPMEQDSGNTKYDDDDAPLDENELLENGGSLVNGNGTGSSLDDYLNSQTVAEDNYNDPNRKYKCHRCKVAFTRQSYLTSHNKTLLHRKGEKMNYPLEKFLDPNRPFKCEICKESFTQKNILLVHYNSVSHLHKLKQCMKESSAAVAADAAASGIQVTEPESEGENKAFRCKLCKVGYSAASALDSHLRSQLHHSRTSKLHELALSGQFDLSSHLIERPDSISSNSIRADSDVASQLPDMLANLNEQQALALQQAAINFALGHGNQAQFLQMANRSSHTCGKCSASFISAEAQQQHQQLCGLFGNGEQSKQQQQQSKLPNYPLTKSKPHLYKHLLESWGFEIVMQFNEGHQKKKPNPENRIEAEANDDKLGSKEKDGEQRVSEEDNDPPELNKCQCDICFKDFSSIWVLKAHREEIHKDILPLDIVSSFADEYRSEYEQKFPNGNEEETNELQGNDEPNTCNNAASTNESNISGKPMSNIESNVNNTSNGSFPGLAQFMPNLPANASSGEIAAANQMAAAQIQFSQLLMNMGLAGMAAGMPMQAGMNAMPFAAAAAMGIPPQLIPLMMADPMMAAAAFNNPAFAAAAAAQMNSGQSMTPNSAGAPSPSPSMQVPTVSPAQSANSQMNAQAAAAAAAQQKRARTRISDDQLKVLRQYFDINNSPTEDQLIEMSHKSGLPMKVIKHWFRNTLFKERQRNKDSPYNFNNPPSTFLNLDEYEKTGEAKVVKLEEVKKEPIEPPFEPVEKGPSSEKVVDYESETETKNCLNDLKSSSSTKDTDYSDDEDGGENKKQKFSKNIQQIQNPLSIHIQSHQAQLQQQEFDHFNKSINFNIHSPQPSESSMSSNCESTGKNNNSVFPGLSNFGSGLSSGSNMTSSPLFAMDASHRSMGGNSSSMMPNSPHNISSHSSSGKRANRTRFTDYQIKVLQEFFESNAYPKDDDLEYLSKLLNLSPRVIVVWFQNARQKARKVYENQPPSTPIEQDDGSGRFQRTPGLNYQCKKCLQVFQRYYELIKHQKSSCFKDENPLAAQIRMAAEARGQATSPAMSSSRDGPSTPMDCSRSATATPEKFLPLNMLTSPGQLSSVSPTLQSNSVTAKSSPSNESKTFCCDKCPKVFNRYDLFRDHQIVHIVNSNLFNSSVSNPFINQHADAHFQQQSLSQSAISPQQTVSPNCVFQQGVKRKTTTDDEDEESHDFDSMSGNGGGSNSGDQTPRDKRLRTTILPEQLDYLYQKYQIESNPSRKMLESIAKEVGLKKRVVQVWFQNTRARERKGQFRAHQQVIHKRCPFCRALFKARSALESHLATRHADQYTKGDINIDALPDGDPSEDGDEPAANLPESTSDNPQVADVVKRYYEDSFKKYLDEMNMQGNYKSYACSHSH